MIYIEIICNDCGADVGYGKFTGEGAEKCQHCGSENLNTRSYYDD